MRVAWLAVGLLLCAGCHESATGSDGGAGDLGALDSGAGGDGALGDGGCGGVVCAAPQVCRYDTCIDPPAACTTDQMCEDDSYCEMGECLPYGVGPRGPFDPTCKRLDVLGLFSPRAQCQWSGPAANDFPDSTNVLSTPLVADFDFDGDPKTVHPSIVFVTYNCTDGGCGDATNCYGVIRVIDGATCAPEYSMGAPGLIIGDVTPAIGDLDGDGRPDIVTERQNAAGGGVVGYKYDKAQDKFVPLWTNYASFNATGCHWDSLAIHDLDDDGVPEIVQAGPFPAVYNNQGMLIASSTANTSYSDGLHPVLADLDGDGSVEMVDGKEAFRFDKTTKQWTLAAGYGGPSLGQTAIADFGTFGADPTKDDRSKLDGIPEIAVVTSGQVRVQTLAGRVVFGPIGLPGTTAGTGGAPTIADFDGDGRAEIGVAGATAYGVFDPDCVAGAAAKKCPSGATTGILWSKQSQDLSSNVTGSSVFDFDGDGKAEVVYADECFSRVYDGTSGDVLFSQFHTSCTWYENPIVADVSGNFRSAVVIPSNVNCNVSCPALDPIDDGVRCDTGADCPGTTTCVRENAGDQYGRCRCAADADCGSPSLSCADPIAGPSPMGKVCRAQHPQGTAQSGVLVLHDVLDRWVPSRHIWNQHAYAVTNVNEDGTIPKTSAWLPNWKQPNLNNFRQNTPGQLDPKSVPDLTSSGTGAPGIHESLMCDPNGTLQLQARVCNRGTGPVGAGLPVTFYVGAKANNMPICTAMTTMPLQSGACEVVGCPWPNAPKSPTDVTISADDDGTGKATSTECDGSNDIGTLLGVSCNPIG